jgi:hypothetical protein
MTQTIKKNTERSDQHFLEHSPPPKPIKKAQLQVHLEGASHLMPCELREHRADAAGEHPLFSHLQKPREPQTGLLPACFFSLWLHPPLHPTPMHNIE